MFVPVFLHTFLRKSSATCRGCAASAWDRLRKQRNLGRLRHARRRFSWFQGVARDINNSSRKSVSCPLISTSSTIPHQTSPTSAAVLIASPPTTGDCGENMSQIFHRIVGVADISGRLVPEANEKAEVQRRFGVFSLSVIPGERAVHCGIWTRHDE